MQGVVQPITAGVAGKHPAGPVSAVSRGCQPDDEQPRARVAEPRDWTAPVFLSGKLPFPQLGYLSAVRPESRTEFAGGNQVCQPRERRWGGRCQVRMS